MPEPELSVPLHWSTSTGVRQIRILSQSVQRVCVWVCPWGGCVGLCDIFGLDEKSYWQSGSPSHWHVCLMVHTARRQPPWPGADTEGGARDNVLLFVLPRTTVCWGWVGAGMDKVGVWGGGWELRARGVSRLPVSVVIVRHGNRQSVSLPPRFRIHILLQKTRKSEQFHIFSISLSCSPHV